MTAVILTANFGDHDTVRAPVAQDIEVEWLCYTDGSTEAPEP